MVARVLREDLVRVRIPAARQKTEKDKMSKNGYIQQ